MSGSAAGSRVAKVQVAWQRMTKRISQGCMVLLARELGYFHSSILCTFYSFEIPKKCQTSKYIDSFATISTRAYV